jgi:hypothetical protein
VQNFCHKKDVQNKTKVFGRRGLEFRQCPSTFTADEGFGNSLSNLGTPSAATIYSMYLQLNLSATPDLKF